MSGYFQIWTETGNKVSQKYREQWAKDLASLKLYDLAIKYLAAFDGKVVNGNIKKVFPGNINVQKWTKSKDWSEDGRNYTCWWSSDIGNGAYLTIRELNKEGYQAFSLPSIEIHLPAGERFDYAKFKCDIKERRDEIAKQAQSGIAYLATGQFREDLQKHNALVKALDDLWQDKPIGSWAF